jgi:acyl carrier protein
MAMEVGGAEVAGALNEVLSAVRPDAPQVKPETALATLDLDSQDYIEMFIVLEEQTGAVFDLSVPPDPLLTVADLARYRRVE